MTTAMMAKRSIQLGGKHLRKFFCIPIRNNIPAYRKAELAVLDILRNTKKLEFVLTVDVYFIDELGQISADLLAVIDIILRIVRNNNLYMGGALLICTMDHTQIQPIRERPVLTCSHMISCLL